jgi:hypothetical protein
VKSLSILIQTHTPALLWGQPGSGKTSAVEQIAEALRVPIEIVIASIREPSDFAGLPVVHDGDVRLAPPAWARRLVKAERGILFLDEISTVSPSTQAALLRVVLDRVVGDLPLPDGISVVAAANPPEQAAGGWDLSPPLANRFCHLTWTVDAQAWADGMVSGFPAPPVLRLPKDWQKEIPAARALVASFIRHRPALLMQVPPDDSSAGRAYPTCRTWDLASRLIAACQSVGEGVESPVALELVSGCVGEGAALEFLHWVKELNLPDPEQLLQDPDALTLPRRGDQAFAILSSVVSAVIARLTTERWNAAWEVMAKACDLAPDIAAVAARALGKCRPNGASVPKVAIKFAPLLKAAGVTWL